MGASDVFAPATTPHPSPPAPDGEARAWLDDGTLLSDTELDQLAATIHRIQTVADDDARFHADRLPLLDLPTFGDPRPDCGRVIPPAKRFCEDCGTVHEGHHVCNTYDCEMHGLHTVRRRAVSVVSQLESMRLYLNAFRPHNHSFHHLIISPPPDLNIAAQDPLRRMVTCVRELMDALGVQGQAAYHPWRGEHEDVTTDDRGEWRRRLGKRRAWADVRDELVFSPHFHVVGVAPAVDLSMSGELYDETGWVLHRITKPDSNVSISNFEDMARAVTYTLSHAGVYDTPEQRRLAAWMKGPDVNNPYTTWQTRSRAHAVVNSNAVSRKVLGLDPVSQYCNEPKRVDLDFDDGPGEFERFSQRESRREERLTATPGPIGGPAGPRVDPSWSPGDVYLPGDAAVNLEAVGGFDGRRWDEDDDEDAWAGDGSTSGGSATRVRVQHRTAATADDDQDDDVQDDADDDVAECGGILRPITAGFDYYTDPDWREWVDDADAVERVERAYLDMVRWLEAHNLKVGNVEPLTPEERTGPDTFSDLDPPPSD